MNKKNKKESIVTIWSIYIIVGVFSIVGGPIIVNELCKFNNRYVIIWGAETTISYYGSILGAIATIVAVLITISDNEKKRKIDRKNQIKPLLDHQMEIHPTDNLKVGNVKEHNVILMTFDHVKEMGIIDKEILSNIRKKESLYMQYHISNVGAGNALLIKLIIDGKVAIRPFNIQANSSKVITIIVDKSYMDQITNMNIELIYRNVDGSAFYKQGEILAFVNVENDFMSLNISDRIDSQEEINKSEYGKF